MGLRASKLELSVKQDDGTVVHPSIRQKTADSYRDIIPYVTWWEADRPVIPVDPNAFTTAKMLATPGCTWAHRGGSASFPEHSEYAYDQAVQLGYKCLEFSAQRTSDGWWFGLHNNSLTHVTGGAAPETAPRNMTRADVEAYRITINSQDCGPQPFYGLEEFCEKFGKDYVLIIDPKNSIDKYREFIELVDGIVDPTHLVFKFFGDGQTPADAAKYAESRGWETWGFFYQDMYESGSMARWAPYYTILGMDYTATTAWTAPDGVLSFGKPVVGHICGSLAAYQTAITKGASMVQCSNVRDIPAVPRQPSTAQQLTVLQLNLWHGASKVSDGIAATADVIEQLAADVVMLSEAAPGVVSNLQSELAGRRAAWFAAGTGDTGIVSRYPISGSRAVTDYATRGIVTLPSGIEIAVYSLHLEYRWYACYLPRGYNDGAPGRGWAKLPSPVTDVQQIGSVNRASGRQDTILTILQDAAAQRAEGRDALIGGDYNEPSHFDWTATEKDTFERNGVTYAWDTLKTLAAAGWVDGYRQQHPNPRTHPGITWPSDNPAVSVADLSTGVTADVRDRIDYIHHLAAGRLTLTTARLVGPTGTIRGLTRVPGDTQDDFAPLAGTWPTDHKGNLQTFTITN